MDYPSTSNASDEFIVTFDDSFDERVPYFEHNFILTGCSSPTRSLFPNGHQKLYENGDLRERNAHHMAQSHPFFYNSNAQCEVDQMLMKEVEHITGIDDPMPGEWRAPPFHSETTDAQKDCFPSQESEENAANDLFLFRTSLNCNLCGRFFPNFRELFTHKRTDHTILESIQLTRPIKKDSKEKKKKKISYYCTDCNIKFVQILPFENHMKFCKKKQQVLDNCRNATLPRSPLVLPHLECKTCGNQFSYTYVFNQHKTTCGINQEEIDPAEIIKEKEEDQPLLAQSSSPEVEAGLQTAEIRTFEMPMITLP